MSDEKEVRTPIMKGDVDAFQQAYVRHFPSVRTFIRMCLGNAAGVDDLAQDTFLQLWRNPDRFDPCRSNLKTYLLGIARKKVSDWWRRAEKQPAEQKETVSPPIQPNAYAVHDRRSWHSNRNR